MGATKGSEVRAESELFTRGPWRRESPKSLAVQGSGGDGIERSGTGWDEPTQAYARGGRLGRGEAAGVDEVDANGVGTGEAVGTGAVEAGGWLW